MVSGIVRPIALCVVRHDEKLLVFEGYDTAKKGHFYRPLGGTIEFGEPSANAAAREMAEELNAESPQRSVARRLGKHLHRQRPTRT